MAKASKISGGSDSASDGSQGSVLRIGEQEFQRGERGVVDVAVGHMIDYQPVNMTVHVRRGRRPGPCLIVSAALHGDEINGVEIVRRVLRTALLNRLRGDLIAVPVVNVPAFLARSRYLPDRRDLNRLFPGSSAGSLGARLAYCFVNQVLVHCTHSIDIHTGALNRPNLPQVRYSAGDEESLAMAKAFHAPVVLESAIRDGSLRQTLFGEGKSSIVFEGGEAHRLDPASVRYGVRGVISVMRYLGMLPKEKSGDKGGSGAEEGSQLLNGPRRRMKTLVSRFTFWTRAPRGGIFTPYVEIGKAVGPDTVLGIVADPFGRHETTVYAKEEGVIIARTFEATVDEGDALFHIALTRDPGKMEQHILRSGEDIEQVEDSWEAW